MNDTTTSSSSHFIRPPVVAVLGHVDHGKTTLLDTIRKTHVALGEHGGITQTIGAYQIRIPNPKSQNPNEERKITFIDTPGHEAFAAMRSRGVSAADIAVLVVAADDSVKPQTVESIAQIKSAGTPMIVAINKIDLPAANAERVKQDLAKHGVQVEGFGGDIPCTAVSAKAGTGINGLLELILLVADIKGLTGDPQTEAQAVVIETRLDKGKGMVATAVVKNGTLAAGMPLFAGTHQIAKIRAMRDEHGASVECAIPGDPVEILGFTQHPHVGEMLYGSERASATEAGMMKSSPQSQLEQHALEMPDFLKPVDPEAGRMIKIILKADTAGSLEAITSALPKKVVVVGQRVGDITEADILSAKSTGAIVIGFGVAPKGAVVKLAETEKVIYRTYRIIYELLDELSEVVAGLKEVLREERDLGTGSIIAEFPFEKDRIAGCKVISGRIARGDRVKIMRAESEIARGKIKSIRHGRDDMTRADAGIECGILFDQKLDFTIGDGIIAFTQ